MTAAERQEKLTFVSRDFVNLVKKMYLRRCYFGESVFRLDEDSVKYFFAYPASNCSSKAK